MLKRDQDSDEVDGSFVSRLQELCPLGRADLFCDGKGDCLEVLLRDLNSQKPRFFVVHGHAMMDVAGVPIGGVSSQDRQVMSAGTDSYLL
eukprot:6255516-Amphidinium_carterae.1